MNAKEYLNFELECYLKIIDRFLKSRVSSGEDDMLKSKSIIKLMKNSKCKDSSNFVKNALVLVLSLYDKKPLDLYNARGDVLEECNASQRSTLLLRLKKELY